MALCYVLHSGNLYGTERMALATLTALQKDITPILLTPNGVVVPHAKKLGIEVFVFSDTRSLIRVTRQILHCYPRLTFLTTSIKQAMIAWGLNLFYWRIKQQIHMVHGGTDEAKSYARKHYLDYLSMPQVVNSQFSYQRLHHYGTKKENIHVIPNFLPSYYSETVPKRPVFKANVSPPIKKLIIVSRVDKIKRIDLILEALSSYPDLHNLHIDIYGTGEMLYQYRDHVAKYCPQVTLHGFEKDIPSKLSQADALLHLCPVEPFGLVVLEAMAAGLPVIVPDTGGAAELVIDDISGFRFTANDVDALASCLLAVQQQSVEKLNTIVANARDTLTRRYSTQACLPHYQRLLKL